jgi:hypothetical protein
MPGSTAWLMASPTMAICRNTKKLPISAQLIEINEAVNMM